MGKKISIDSATMMNKVFEIIEAKNIFNISYRKIFVIIHPKSYIHSLVKFIDGRIKILAHIPDMKIPIHNSLFHKKPIKIETEDINFEYLNNLNFEKMNPKKFPITKIIKYLPNNNTLYETALVTINDFFVDKFLNNKISFKKLIELILNYAQYYKFTKFKKSPVLSIDDIISTRNYVILKLDSIGI